MECEPKHNVDEERDYAEAYSVSAVLPATANQREGCQADSNDGKTAKKPAEQTEKDGHPTRNLAPFPLLRW